ncbi:pyridoxal phosphate-dependent aminotransferase [Desulfococcaceae bacterium OttesenSCG-928-F15]|nr:pyridoxal phosphate-dependent aminotransferase [Desulfococcaceae bacterium OttesenSCG-928-F15]
MRRDIVHVGSGQLTYEIREIVAVANELQRLGVEITWENIGDPIHKGEKFPDWMKEIVHELVSEDLTYGYVATPGILETREFLAQQINERGGYQVTADDILFFNGLGDAVTKIFAFLKREARVIGPTPAYSTHSSAEAAHSDYEHLTYELDPENGWQPDFEDLENKVKYNDSIAGILLINPGNPTGAVYSTEVVQKIVDLAKKYDLFVITDEIYAHIAYGKEKFCHLSEVIGDVPGIAMRGISKEYPWPGSRCGWIEIFNQNRYPMFADYIKSLRNAKMLEVCSTSLPQYSIPRIIGDPRYIPHLEMRAEMFRKRSMEASEFFNSIPGISVVPAEGAFYMTVLFDEGVLNDKQFLSIDKPNIQKDIEEKVKGVALDKRFVYYLLAATGICIVPLTGFYCKRYGFRITLLEMNDEKRRWTWETIGKSIQTYLASA